MKHNNILQPQHPAFRSLDSKKLLKILTSATFSIVIFLVALALLPGYQQTRTLAAITM